MGNYKAFLVVFFAAFVCNHAFEITAYGAVDESKIGPKECAKGSSYWCQDLRTAKQCGAVKHCIQVVWQYKKLPPDNSDICETCKKMVQEARDELLSNTTQDLIKQVLEGTCHIYFPIKVIALECVKLVDEFIPELIDMLASRMDPQMVCSVAWLCNSDKIKQLVEDIKIVEKTPQLSDVCQDCKVFISDAIDTAKQLGKDAFLKKLDAACDLLQGFLRTGCHMFISQQGDEIYNYVINDLKPDEACAFVAMCVDGLDPIQKNKNPAKLRLTSKTEDEICDFCVQLTTRLRDMLIANSTKEEVHQLLLTICTQIRWWKECTNYVNTYFDEIYAFLTDELNPKLICVAMDLCPGKKPFIAGNDERPSYENNLVDWRPIQVTPNLNAISKGDVSTKFPFTKPSAHHHIPSATNCDVKIQGGPQCVICEFILHKLQEILSDTATEEKIKQAIEEVCPLLPKTIATQCDAFIEKYGDAILALLAQEMDPNVVCAEIRLCASADNLTPIKEIPSEYMARITQTMRPDQMQLPLQRIFPSVSTFDDKEACLYCQYSMELMHMLLNINGTKDAIILALDDVCHALPKSMHDACDSFIENYAEPIIITLQTQNLTAFCNILSFCQGEYAAGMLQHATSAADKAVEHANGDMCEVCEVTVEMLAKLLKNPDVSKDIVHAIEKVCTFVPGNIRPKCESFIEVYGPYVVQMIGELADAKQVCQAIDLCQPSPGQVQLLGGNKCTYGPDYWCKSKIHARACKAEKHCKTVVWKN